MLALIEFLARSIGEQIFTASGVRLIGRHSWRSAGAVWLAGMRLDLYRIQLIARWASAIVLHYARLAPLKDITEHVRELGTVNSLGKVIKYLKDDLTQMKKKLLKMDANAKTLLEKEVTVAIATEQAKKTAPKFVVNSVTGCCHLIAVASGEPRSWSSACTWEFGFAPHTFADVPAERWQDTCGRCFPDARRRMKRDAGVS